MPKNYEKLAESLQHENNVLKHKNRTLVEVLKRIKMLNVGKFHNQDVAKVASEIDVSDIGLIGL